MCEIIFYVSKVFFYFLLILKIMKLFLTFLVGQISIIVGEQRWCYHCEYQKSDSGTETGVECKTVTDKVVFILFEKICSRRFQFEFSKNF